LCDGSFVVNRSFKIQGHLLALTHPIASLLAARGEDGVSTRLLLLLEFGGLLFSRLMKRRDG